MEHFLAHLDRAIVRVVVLVLAGLFLFAVFVDTPTNPLLFIWRVLGVLLTLGLFVAVGAVITAFLGWVFR